MLVDMLQCSSVKLARYGSLKILSSSPSRMSFYVSLCLSSLPRLGILALGDAFSYWCYRPCIMAACVARDNRNRFPIAFL